ncbi:MAG TPA: CRISPR-associated endonuclease Cas2 [Pyrinomonadaceae bacterium]|nr:CRISPR-associated endonuclease Cas2 [Pyrinomonadaceae bacterium]
MTHVVVYDIEDDRVRARVASVLEGYGSRVQESVFECRLRDGELDELVSRLREELKRPESGQIRVYRVCGSCMQASFGIGDIKSVDTGSCYIV